MELVNLHGGTHHGYFLPAEGASDPALALFVSSLATYERTALCSAQIGVCRG
jgi:hypothetical protein